MASTLSPRLFSLARECSRTTLLLFTSVRCLSRMRTRTPKRVYWFRRLVPPLFDQELARGRLEAEPEIQFKEISPALVNQSSSVFYNPIVDKFTKMIMVKGKREKADEIMRNAFEIMKRDQLEKYHTADEASKEKIELNPVRMLLGAIDNCRPVLCLSGVKRGGIVYQASIITIIHFADYFRKLGVVDQEKFIVPSAITDHKALWTAMKWLILASRDNPKKERSYVAIAREVSSAFYNQGRVVKRKHDLHKQCEANKAYAHYRWSR